MLFRSEKFAAIKQQAFRSPVVRDSDSISDSNVKNCGYCISAAKCGFSKKKNSADSIQ